VAQNKLALNLAKMVKVLLTAETLGKFRELDYITIHSPTLGLNYLKSLVLSYSIDETSPVMSVTLDQYSESDLRVGYARQNAVRDYVAANFTGRF
jgi:hypothetical protein